MQCDPGTNGEGSDFGAATVLVFAAFGLHVASGGAFEMRTVAAMTLRCTVLAAMTLAAHHASKGR